MMGAGRTVTKCATNLPANQGNPGALLPILSPKRGQLRASKSTAWGNSEDSGGMEGNVFFGLITQRSKVQILPPQPADFSATYIYSILRENRRYSRLDW